MKLLKSIILLGVATSFLEPCFAQRKTHAKTTVATAEEDYYDVKYVKLDIRATNTSTSITGKTTTVASVTVPTMNVYAFELSPQLTIDSVKIDGNLVPVQSTGFVHMATLPNVINQGVSFTSDVWYHGQPTGGTNFFTNGLLNQTDATIPVQVTHTVSAAYHSRDWWACKQSLSDKIDSSDIWVTVPMGLKVASNGLLKNVTTLLNSDNRFEWSLRNPVDYYLLSFAVAPYDEYNYYMHFPTGDSMLINNYIYSDPSILQNHKDELDSIKHMINHYSTIFGKYPYHNEKFGICLAPLSGGMENQTMVTVGSLDATLIAHELSHQWWGDNVTCHSLVDMWLNEGWATYAEHLYIEKFWGTQAAKAWRNQTFNYVMTGAGGSVYVTDTTNELRIYDGRLTYNKGAALAHMLRYLIDDDAKFFQTLTTYQQQYKNATATTEDLKNLAEQISGIQLDTFFQQWYMAEGFPFYDAKWYQDANGNVTINLDQTTSRPASVSVFKMPIVLQLKSSQGDTLIRVTNTQASETYHFNWSKQMNDMDNDPENHIVNRIGSIIKDPTLSASTINKEQIKIFPNPSASGWNIINLPKNAKLSLLDVSGRTIWDSIAATDNVVIPSSSLAPGTYLLHIELKDKTAINYYLSR